MKIDQIIDAAKSTFCFTDDLICREILIAKRRALFVFLDGGTDKTLLDRDVIAPLLALDKLEEPIVKSLQNAVFYAESINVVQVEKFPQNVADGDVAWVICDKIWRE